MVHFFSSLVYTTVGGTEELQTFKIFIFRLIMTGYEFDPQEEMDPNPTFKKALDPGQTNIFLIYLMVKK